MRRIREGQHRRQAPRCIRAGHGHVRGRRPRAAEGLVWRRCSPGTTSTIRRCSASRPVRKRGIIAGVTNTDFLQAVSLFHTRDRRRAAEQAGKHGKELPAVTGNRQALLNLPLEGYKKYEAQVESGFMQAAKFLHMLHIYRIFDLPYQSQIVALAAILADIGDGGSTKPIARSWSAGTGTACSANCMGRRSRAASHATSWRCRRGSLEALSRPRCPRRMFRSDRLKTMRMRLSAAYKGVNALLMKEGAQDFRSGQQFDHTVFFGENVDIHHIFPQDWCKGQGIKQHVYDSIINKTPLSYRTNRMIGGVAPSAYLAKLQTGNQSSPPIAVDRLDTYLSSHLIEPELLRADDFEQFMADRQTKLLALIERATGRAAYAGDVEEEGQDVEDDEDTVEASLTIAGPESTA